MYEVWRGASDLDGGRSSVLDVVMQGSNDLSNWTDITGSTQTMSASGPVPPDYKSTTVAGVLPWAFVRLKYSHTIDTTGSGTNVRLMATLETFAA
jgi:hypothetical protein